MSGRKNKSGRRWIIMRSRPVDERLIQFLHEKSFHTMSDTSVIREALAYRAESRGMDVAKLFAEFAEQEQDNESTPA